MNPLPPSDPGPDDAPPLPDFARALEEFEKGAGSAAAAARAEFEIKVGMKVRGKVVAVDERQTLVDFGGRSEGVADTRQFRDEDGTLRVAVGDALDLFVVRVGDEVVLAPSMRADPHAAWQQVREAHKAGVPVAGRVTGVNAGGLAVDVGGLRAFCPVSQIEAGFCADPAAYVGRTLEFLVTAMEEARRGAVLSRRQLLRQAEEEKARRLVAALKPGDELPGKVSRLEAFGAFVDLGGVEGLVHVSEIRHERTAHPREALRPGDEVRVRVLHVDQGKDGRPRIALSIKASAPDPWADVGARFAAGARVQGVVARLVDFGAFVTLAPGVDGLVHVSEAAPHRVQHVKEVLSPGQSVEAVVIAVDPGKKRISLSLREALAASSPPPRTPAAGELLEGRVAGVKPFGVFVDLPECGPRVTGLLPREETGQARGADLGRAFPVGEALRVEILDVREGRIRLRVARDLPVERGGEARGGGGETAGGPGKAERPPAPAGIPKPPMTAMAIALRKAMEEARKREERNPRE